MYVTEIPSTTIQVPTIVSGTNMMTVTTGTSSMDARIFVTQPFLYTICRQIIEKEMRQLRQKHPEVDVSKIQEMLNSRDEEMRKLGLTTLGKFTNYTARILASPNDTHNLEYIIEEYSYHNLNNIMEDVL